MKERRAADFGVTRLFLMKEMLVRGILILVSAVVAACSFLPEAREPDARILAMGDSVLGWNRGERDSIIDRVEKRLGEAVLDASVPGAAMRRDGLPGAIGLSIPGQYRSGDWDAVIVNGGANDLLGTCGCKRCDAIVDRLVREDYPALINRLGDTQVFILGYYGPAGDRPGSFNTCDDELQAMERHLTRLAARLPNVHVVPVRSAVTGRPALYDSDRVHPSPAGSAVIGDLLAGALAAKQASPRRRN